MDGMDSYLGNPNFIPDYTGWLVKRSRWLLRWRKRYFFLKGNKLYFSKDSKLPPHGIINLGECISVKSAETDTQIANSFQIITSKEIVYLIASDIEDKDNWIGCISRY